MTSPLLLLLAPLLASAQPVSPPLSISSAAVSSPYDLVRGTLPAPGLGNAALDWFPELLEYEVKWGVLSMGFANLGVKTVVDFNGQPAYHIVSQARSSPFADRFYKVRDVNESWVSVRDLHSLGYQKKLREGDFQRDEWVVYDYPRKSYLAKRVNKGGDVAYSSGTIPGQVADVLSSLYYLRPKPLKVGDEVTLDVNTRENWPLVVKVLQKTTIEVPAGRFRCVVVEPFVRQEGIFIHKGRSLKVWMTDDERHMPVMLQVEIVFGSVSAYLQRIRK